MRIERLLTPFVSASLLLSEYTRTFLFHLFSTEPKFAAMCTFSRDHTNTSSLRNHINSKCSKTELGTVMCTHTQERWISHSIHWWPVAASWSFLAIVYLSKIKLSPWIYVFCALGALSELTAEHALYIYDVIITPCSPLHTLAKYLFVLNLNWEYNWRSGIKPTCSSAQQQEK